MRQLLIRFGITRAVLTVSVFTLLVQGQTAAANVHLAQNAGHDASKEISPQAKTLRELTSNVIALASRSEMVGRADEIQTLNTLLYIAATRQHMLAALMEHDPGEVLRVAVPATLRASLPTAVQVYVEQQVEVDGELQVLYEDWETGSRLLYFLDIPGERLSLYFATDPPTHLRTGSRIRFSGVRVADALAVESGSTSARTAGSASLKTSRSANSPTLAATPANTFGEQKTIVILVNFQDNATLQPYTLADADSVVFGTTSNFDLENSYQQTWLTGTVCGWYTISLDSTVCDSSKIASFAEAAATASGVDLSLYNRRVYGFPRNACSWSGLASVGGNPSQAWINGSLTLKVVSHEMGHNFGEYHSHALDCGTTVLGMNCSSLDYGDTLDTMGNPSSGHFNAFQKERLGWLNYGVSPPITTVQAGGTYSVDLYESAGSNAKALKILKATDATTGMKTWYYVEYRGAFGFDNFLSGNGNVQNGVVIRTGSESSGNSSYLLNMTPALSSWSDPALDVGYSFHDPDAGVTIAPVSVSSTSAAVSVSFDAQTCLHANPTVTLSPSQSQWVTAGTTVTYTVLVANNDNGGCTISSFNLQASMPIGWVATFAASTLSISPGSTASTTLLVISPAWAAAAFYTIGVTAANNADPSYSTSTSGTYVIVSSLSVTISTDQSSYARNTWVSITARVSVGGSPSSGAGVTFTITKPDTTVATGTATTGADGLAVFKYRVKRQDPLGIYQGKAAASVNGISGSAATNFTVH